MTTSLSEQLKRLSVPQSKLIQRDKKRPSLLFDFKEAATLKRETIYQIGLDGLEELITKNGSFEQFKNNLFHTTSKKFERSVQTFEDNKKLDKVVRKFLLHLSPYFLLSCSHKALEWLINRFNIHEFNRNDILMVFIPYHESNIFVRLVQLMTFKENHDSWLFLKSLQKTGVHLTKKSLLNHAANDVNFLKIVGKFIVLLLKTHEKPTILTVAFNFYCSVFTGAVEFSKTVTEPQITQMLPILLKGLNSDIPDFCGSSYIILGRLVMKTSLSDSIFHKFVEKVSEANVETLKTETILLLLMLYQYQTEYDGISEQACLSLIQKDWLPKIVQDLSNENYYVTPFLRALVKGCVYGGIKLDQGIYRDFLRKLLRDIKFDDGFMEIFLSILLDGTRSKKEYSTSTQSWLSEIIETLENQYPEQFDNEVYKILSNCQTINKRRRSLQKILKDSMNSSKKFDILLKLYHPKSSFRQEAIRYLIQNYKNLKQRDKDMIESSFIDRLNDEDIKVVIETINLMNNIPLLNICNLKPVLIKLAYKYQENLEKYENVAIEIMLILCANSDISEWETFIAVLPYLLPNSEEQLRGAQKLAQTSFVKKHPLLKAISHDVDDFEIFCDTVIDSLRNDDLKLILSFLQSLKLNEEQTVLNKYLIIMILSCILPGSSSIEIVLEIVEIFSKLIETCQLKFEKSNAFFQRHLAVARTGKFHIEAYLLCLKNIILKMKKPTKIEFSLDDAFSKCLLLLAQSIFKDSQNHKKYTWFLINYFCDTLTNKIDFCLNLTLFGKHLNFSNECLKVAVKLVESGNKNLEVLLQGDTICYLIALLVDKSQEIRANILRIIDVLANVQNGNIFENLLKELMEQSEEIIADSDQTALILYNYLSPSNSVTNIEKIKTLLVTASSDRNNPVYLKVRLLEAISHLNGIEIFTKTSQDCLQFFDKIDEETVVIIGKNILRFQSSLAAKIRSDSPIWELFGKCLTVDFASVALLEQISQAFFEELSQSMQVKVLDLIIETSSVSQNPEILPKVRQIIKTINLDARLILPHFIGMRDVQSPKLDVNKLKRRISVVPTIDILDTLAWKKGISALEFIQDKKKLSNVNLLLPLLFDVLKKCLDFDEQAAVEYPKQLILSSILDLSGRVPKNEIPETMFNMELIVQCIRASQNPQTHYCALLLLAFSAELFPSQVLHNIMAIFTFMGSSLLRHEDAYSFQIISKIIDTIIPVLLNDNFDTVAKVLRVFVDVILDVPEHRRMPIYKQLLNKIGTANLYIFLLLIFESHVNKSAKDPDSKRLETAASICREFPPKLVIENCIHLLKYLKDLPDDMETDCSAGGFDIRFKTPKQFRHFKYTLITFLSKLIGSKEFVFQIATLKNEDLLNLEQPYRDMIINVLTYIHRVFKIAEKNGTTPQAKYWKVILHLSYDILDSVNAILTPQMFLLVVKGLMVHNFSTVKRRSMELLNSKLQQDSSSFFSECTTEEIYSLVPPLLSIIKNFEQSEDEVIVQTALLSLKLLVKFLAKEYSEKLTEILDFLTDLIKCVENTDNVLASMLLCLAELFINLRAHAIPSLPHVMPVLLKILKQKRSQDLSSLLLLSSITATQKILETLPLFLSPYLEKLLYELAVLSTKWTDDTSQPVSSKLLIVRQQTGKLIPSRVLIPNLSNTYNRIISKQVYPAIGFLMNILEENLNNLNRNEINANLPELTGFFLNALQFRTSEGASFEQANLVETQIVSALSKLILKLSESTFKPLYYKLYDWAIRHQEKSERLITFYALSANIAEHLKSLFVLFAGHFLNNAAQILSDFYKTREFFQNDHEKDHLLVENVLSTLKLVFTYDNHRFINKERFQVLMQALVDQLEIDDLTDLVGSTIVEFAIATNDDFLWKQLNYQILLKMKHNSARIRLNSLNCLKEIVKKLGIDYLPLLPETIPVLAELLEDEEEDIEKACKKAVQEMEKVLGEPMEKYFKM